MNYRHIYHAGNFADVLKHAVLARLVRYLQNKDKAFRVLDTHAGIGLYDLSSEEAQKTGEWQTGIGKLMDADLPAPIAGLLEPYLSAVRELNPDGGVQFYPGSPKLARMLFRPQ
ncbi:23S rRNA (adenine(2030)-N(6))-methyltransferase RlmJ, partial [Rhizobium sp.]|uniref:23S rRNA (adenine(2030)-N(6))-methyltransferase RlmJ n=1 Tax=Rhizobium sp. TaxID=391 RepID=UPI0028A9CB42